MLHINRIEGKPDLQTEIGLKIITFLFVILLLRVVLYFCET